MSDQVIARPSVADSLRANWGWFLALGIVFVAGGAFAIAMPFIAGVAVTLVVGWSLIVIGAIQLLHAWLMRTSGAFAWQLIIGLIILVGGIAMIVNPIVAAVTLTLLLGIIFVAKGAVQVVLGLRIRPHDAWGWIVAAGVLAIVVGVMIIASWPSSAEWALGTLAGISLIFSGWSYVMIALAARRIAS